MEKFELFRIIIIVLCTHTLVFFIGARYGLKVAYNIFCRENVVGKEEQK